MTFSPCWRSGGPAGGPGQRRRRALAAVAIAVAAASCSDGPSVPAGLEVEEEGRGQPVGSKGPCKLFTVEEVGLAINALPGRGGEPRPLVVGMTMCSVDGGASSRDGATSRLAWGVLPRGGRRRFDQYVKFHRRYVTKVDGLGDAAVWDAGLNTVLVVRENTLLGVQVAVADPPLGAEEKDRASHERTTAVQLAARALRRL